MTGRSAVMYWTFLDGGPAPSTSNAWIHGQKSGIQRESEPHMPYATYRGRWISATRFGLRRCRQERR
jgi:hypothetical protein